jgi:hypothetical protein
MDQPVKKKKPLQVITKLFQKSGKKDKNGRASRSQSKEQLYGKNLLVLSREY